MGAGLWHPTQLAGARDHCPPPQYGAHLIPFTPDDAGDFRLPTEKSLKVCRVS